MKRASKGRRNQATIGRDCETSFCTNEDKKKSVNPLNSGMYHKLCPRVSSKKYSSSNTSVMSGPCGLCSDRHEERFCQGERENRTRTFRASGVAMPTLTV